MTATELTERIREYLADQPSVTEKPMFGVRAFMVGGKMIACAQRDGGLLVRTAPERHDELTGRPGASHATMGPKRREMGAGWIEVSPAVVGDDETLEFWLELALAYNRSP